VKIPHLPSHYRHTLVISLANSGRKARALARAAEFSHEVVWSPGVLANPDQIAWNDINGMEAYFSDNYFRSRYIPAAIGCRLAGLAAFEKGVELAEAVPGGVRGFIVCEDDFMLKDPELFLRCFKDLPEDADAGADLRPSWDLPEANYGRKGLHCFLAFCDARQGDHTKAEAKQLRVGSLHGKADARRTLLWAQDSGVQAIWRAV
jgi:hypothetical protein